MNNIQFSYYSQFGNTTLIFNGYKYRTYDRLTADRIIKQAQYQPGKAWNTAKNECEYIAENNIKTEA